LSDFNAVEVELFRDHSLGSGRSLKHDKGAEAVGREAAIANKTPLIHIPGLPEVEWGTDWGGVCMKMSRIFFSRVPDARVDRLITAKGSRSELISGGL
jgi:hypothetical protein